MTEISIMMPDFVKLIEEHIPDPMVIVDLGSMDAKDSLYLKSYFPNARVYSIEGLEENYILIKNIPQIIPIQAVVCSIDGETNFHKKNVNGIHGIYDRGEKYGSEKRNVKCCTFKTLAKEVMKEPTIDVLKIDVEGATYDVLFGMGDFIHNINMMHIETETHAFFAGQVIEDGVFDYLMNHDFKMLDRRCCEINRDAFQCDSVWINRRIYDGRLVGK